MNLDTGRFNSSFDCRWQQFTKQLNAELTLSVTAKCRTTNLFKYERKLVGLEVHTWSPQLSSWCTSWWHDTCIHVCTASIIDCVPISPAMGGWILMQRLIDLLRLRPRRQPTAMSKPKDDKELELHRCYSAFNIFGVVLSSMAWLFAFSGESGGWSAKITCFPNQTCVFRSLPCWKSNCRSWLGTMITRNQMWCCIGFIADKPWRNTANIAWHTCTPSNFYLCKRKYSLQCMYPTMDGTWTISVIECLHA